MYDGSAYCGFQRQEIPNTIQYELEQALTVLCKQKTPIIASGRTDTGVHALQTFIHFDTDNPISSDFQYHLNAILSKNISAKNIYLVEPNAHARFDAIQRSYIYKIHFTKDPFAFPYSFQFTFAPLNFEKMNEAAAILKQYNDFEIFCKSGGNNKTTLCNITQANWIHNSNTAQFYITANRFLRGMVRLIVGAMLNVGIGSISVSDFEQAILRKNKFKINKSAPAKGLYLSEVLYPENIFKNKI